MTAQAAADEIRLSRVLLLLALSVFINNLDRGNLSIIGQLAWLTQIRADL
jgi:hypothetical protein